MGSDLRPSVARRSGQPEMCPINNAKDSYPIKDTADVVESLCTLKRGRDAALGMSLQSARAITALTKLTPLMGT